MKTCIVNRRNQLKSVETFEGEPIEYKVQRVVENNEPITDGAPIIHTEKSEGVVPAYNVRTDKWDVALNAMDKVNATKIAISEGAGKEASEGAGEGGSKGTGEGANEGIS